MAEIHSFRGVHYNESLITDWSALICPIYAIISQQLQSELYRRSQYNFVRSCWAEDCRSSGETLVRDWDCMVTFYRFPQEHLMASADGRRQALSEG